MYKHACLCVLLSGALTLTYSQTSVHGIVTDAITNVALTGATISAGEGSKPIITNSKGVFSFTSDKDIDSLFVSFTGYADKAIAIESGRNITVALQPSFINLNEVVVSASREKQSRQEVPVAINVISKATINETKATRLDMLLNKVPGVFMVDLGNEQHSMSMRQPLGYNNLFLYLEDGVPIRTIGDFNHNALIEINQASMARIEVIKGPASSLYGSEAVGGAVNFITQSPSVTPSVKLQAEAGSFGYKRTGFSLSNTFNKLGLYVGGYFAERNEADNLHNNFHKGAITLRVDYSFNNKTKLTTTADYINYKTDQKGGLDSLHFYNKDYTSFYRFTYRKVDALRLKAALTQKWNDQNTTVFTLYYRHSSIGQNPFYYISDNRLDPTKASGQVNTDAFHSYGAIIQHTKTFNFLQAKWIVGLSEDISPATYNAKFIDINVNPEKVHYNYILTDSLLTNYNVRLLNTAVYTQFDFNPTNKLKLVFAGRYDRMHYAFDNHLLPSAYTGAPDASNYFDHFTPKIGATYNLAKNTGLYTSYSVGFAPPNITDLYSGVKVPVLKPSSYQNYEVGGWTAFANNKAYAEVSLYEMYGTNEIVNVRLDDGTYQNQNTGKTLHKGIEASLKYTPAKDVMLRMGGTFADHQYKDFVLNGKNYGGNEMAQAPHLILNSEITFKPSFVEGLRIALEWQRVGNYYTDAANTQKYKGFNLFNLRAGYSFKDFEVWANCINVANVIYATTVEKSVWGTTYRPGDLRTINVGLAYHFNKTR
ncbi:MAG: TonB-dependent receptor [Ilyomonas sp.]